MDKNMTPAAVRNLNSTTEHNTACLIVAWSVTLSISILPNVIFNELLNINVSRLFEYKLALISISLLISFVWKKIGGLRQYFIALTILYILEWLSGIIGKTPFWISIFGGSTASFADSMMGKQLLRTGVAVMMVAGLMIIKKSRSAFFFVKGQREAVAAPVPWVGMTNPLPWRRFGAILSICITFGTLVFLVIAGAPLLKHIYRALPLFPLVLLFAAMNSFGEEMNYRASLLGTLDGTVGNRQALLITASYFGIGHYYGVPYGIIGVIMAGLLGWMLGKSMLETRGFFWAWFIHFLQDVAIFMFMAIGSVIPGGR